MTVSVDVREALGPVPGLRPSPLARAMLELAAQRVSGALAAGSRALVLSAGELIELSAAPEDLALDACLVQSGRVPPAVIAHHQEAARASHQTLSHVLLQQGVLSEAELKLTRRGLLLDRMSRMLQEADDDPAPPFVPGPSAIADLGSVALAPLLLDALARVAAASDAAAVGAQLNQRIEWLPGPHDALARAWADLGELPPRPAVSTVLAKRPAAAPRIAALVRAGLVRLDPPGRTHSAPPPRPEELPDPPPRSLLPGEGHPAAELALGAPKQPEEHTRPSHRPSPVPGSFRPPRLRLDPGDSQYIAEPLLPTALPSLPRPSVVIDDPLAALEQQIEELERNAAPGHERARVFVQIARVWHERFGSIERAARAYREAASADPTDSNALQQAALHCHYLGERELAERYVQCAVAAATIPIERAAAQRTRALIARAAADTETCIEALCEAAADDPSSSLPHEQVAALLFERDDPNGANAHARLAAATLQEDQPQRALGLLAWALALKPSDVPTAYEYASLLDGTGRRAGAAAILAYAAACSTQPEQRRKLRLAAAERAEACGRSALAAQLLVDAFDAEPHFDLLYGPLDEDLAGLELSEYRAVMLEDLATACPDDQRAYWLERAARAMLAAPEQRDAALWLLFEAVLTDPLRADALSALRAHAASQPELALLANALLTVIAARLERMPREAGELLRELAELAERRLGNPHLALAALQQLNGVGESGPALEAAINRLSSAVQARNAEVEQAERALAAVREPELRGEAALRLARVLPDLPEHWLRLTELLMEGVRSLGPLPALRARLEVLHGLRRDAVALAVFLEDQAEVALDSNERVRMLARLAAVHTVREDTSAVAATCENLLDLDRGCRIAVARLERAARRLGDRKRLARALELRAGLTRRNEERARVLSQLAQIEEAEDSLERAVAHAWEALRADPEAADSCLLLLRHAHLIEPNEALKALAAIENCIGPSRALFTARADAAEAYLDSGLQRSAVQAWSELMPADAEAHGAWLRLCILDGNSQALLSAAERSLDNVQSAEMLDVARVALERLNKQGAPDEAAALALRLLREQGQKDPKLAARAVELARRGQDAAQLTAALEHQVAFAGDDERASVLLELAEHHRRRRDATAELRSLQRALELQPDHEAALARLHELLLEAGDGPRLVALIGEVAAGASEAEVRRGALLELIAVSQLYLNDRERAERYVRALLSESIADPRAVRDTLGLLFTIGNTHWAIERAAALAEEQEPELASQIYLWASVTAEQRANDPALALALAKRGALRWPRFTELLLAVERLTLGSDDVTTAMATYDALITASVGPHGRRALHYRTGRWLERAGLPEQALERYLAAFTLAPSGGAPFRALERVARQTRAVERIVPCYERLAEQVRETGARVALLGKAADLCQEELADPLRAFELLNRANAFTEHFELDERVQACAREVRARDPQVGHDVLVRVVDELEQRAAQIWSAEDKVRLLLRAAALRSVELGQDTLALARVDEASALVRGETLAPEIAAEVAAARAEVGARLGLPEEQGASERRPASPEQLADFQDQLSELREELSAGPGDALADMLADPRQLNRVPPPLGGIRPIAERVSGVPPMGAFGRVTRLQGTLRPTAPALVQQPQSDPTALGEPEYPAEYVPEPEHEPEPEHDPAPTLTLTPASERPFAPRASFGPGPTPGLAYEPDPLRDPAPSFSPLRRVSAAPVAVPAARTAAKTPVALAPATAAAPVPAPAAETAEPYTRLTWRTVPPPSEFSLEELLAFLHAEPWRADLLRAVAAGDAKSAQREARAARLILATFDSELPAPKDPEFHAGLWRGRSLREALGSPLPPDVEAMLALLWHYARGIPRFQAQLSTFGINERDRITRITVGPVAEAYAQVARTLATTDIPVYAPRSSHQLPRVLATHPPSVLVGRSAVHDRQTLLFAMAHSLWLAQPEHVIAAVLDPDDGRDLLDAARLAFAPSPGASLDMALAAKELATSLWQSVPSGSQRVLGETLRKHQDLLVVSDLRKRIRGTAARAALLASGSVRAAVTTLAHSEPELLEFDLSNEAGFMLGCQRSHALAEVVRLALSPAYLDTLAQVSGS